MDIKYTFNCIVLKNYLSNDTVPLKPHSDLMACLMPRPSFLTQGQFQSFRLYTLLMSCG